MTSRPLCVAAVLVVSSILSLPAHAQDAGFEWIPGVRLGSPAFRIFGGGSPAYVDAQQRVVVVDRQEVKCLDSAYAAISTTPAGFNETFSHVAIDSSLSEAWLVSFIATSVQGHVRFSRYSCANGREAQVIDLPDFPIAELSDRVPSATWVMAPGVLEFAARDGVYRVDTASPTPSAQPVTSAQSVQLALGEAAPLVNALATIRRCAPAGLGARTCSVGTLMGQSIVSIDATGLSVTRLEGPLTGTSAPMGTWMVEEPTLGGVFVFPWGRYGPFRRDRPILGFVGVDRSFFPLRPAIDTNAVVGGGLNRVVTGPPGTPYAAIDVMLNGMWVLDLVPLVIDRGGTDFDLDGLTASQELQLGTTPTDDDTDDDGIGDAVEQDWYATDPLDAGSRTPRREPAARWGYNSLVGLPTPLNEPNRVVACPSHDPGPCAPCREANGQVRAATGLCQPTGGLARFATTRDGQAEFIGVKETNSSPQFVALQRLSNDPLLFPSSVPISAGDQIFAVDANTVYQLGRLASGTRLVRFTPQGSEELSLQTGCPLQRTAPGCVERLLFGALSSVELVATHSSRPAVLVRVSGRFGEALVALDERGYHLLADFSELGLDQLVIGFDERFSEFLFTGAGTLDNRHEETWRMGIDFARRTLRRNELETSYGPLSPYRADQVAGGGRGYPAKRQDFWFVDPEPAGGTTGCVSVGSVTVCDAIAFPSTPVPVRFVSMPEEELRPAEPALRPGDVLIATYLGTWTTTSSWGFSKFDRGGTSVNWLSEAEFVALIDEPSERDRLVDAPLEPPKSVAVSPDGLSVCLVERGTSRVWELTLDPSTRVTTRAHRVLASGFAQACAYDPQGQLVIATDSELKRDGTTFASGVGGTQSVAWLQDRWVTWGVGRPAQCFDASGQTDGGLGWDALAVSPFAGGVAWVDMNGRGFAGTLDELCNKLNVPRERLIDDDRMTFYEVLSNDVIRPVSRRRIQFKFALTNATAGALVFRPDGLGLFGAWNRWVEGLGFNTPLKGPDATFLFEPALQPKDLSKRWPQFDPYRRAALSWTFMPAPASPMVLVPGTDVRTGPIRYVEPTPWVPTGGWPEPAPEPTGGGGGSNATGGGGGSAAPQGCTCASADVLGLALGALLLGARRRQTR